MNGNSLAQHKHLVCSLLLCRASGTFEPGRLTDLSYARCKPLNGAAYSKAKLLQQQQQQQQHRQLIGRWLTQLIGTA